MYIYYEQNIALNVKKLLKCYIMLHLKYILIKALNIKYYKYSIWGMTVCRYVSHQINVSHRHYFTHNSKAAILEANYPSGLACKYHQDWSAL